MLIPNEKKGWYGSYSESGRRAARLNFLISKEPLSLETKRKFNTKESLVISAFESSENKNQEIFKKNVDDNLDIFTIDETDKLKLEELTKSPIPNTIISPKEKINKNKRNKKEELNNQKKFYYYNLHRKKRAKEKYVVQGNPPCTKYNPKYTSIFRRSASSPSWASMKSRTTIFDKKIDEHPFYIEHDNILDTMAGKVFIDMKKQKQSDEKKEKIKNNNKEQESNIHDKNISTIKKNKSVIIGQNNKVKNKNITLFNKQKRPNSCINPRMRRNNYSNNLRNKLESILSENTTDYKNTSKSINRNKKATNISRKKIIEIEFNKISSTKINNSRNRKSRSSLRNEISKEPIDISEDSYESYKNIYTKELKRKEDKHLYKTFSKELIKGPNFKQMISRERLDKLKDDKIPIVPYLLPNYFSVRGRPIMMVIYDKKYHKINRNKSDSLIRIDNTFYYDPNKILDKINNHLSSHPPNFKMMTSRPDDDDPLPSYMKRIYTRNSCYEITKASLKSNNFTNRGFAKMHSSFFPKKSFNKVINLNLLKSKKFLNNVIGNENLLFRQFKGLGTSLRFYNKNYEDIMRDNCLEKFDNVTYKTIKKEHSKKIFELVNKIKEEAG